ncbi:MAG: DNA alkylation repair protein [Pirellulales bacterium]
MTAAEILKELKPLGSESYKKTMLRHGAQEPCFGVKIEELQKIRKRIKQDYQLAIDLFDTGVYDAMYLAGLVADDLRMTKKDLTRWINQAHSPTIAEYTVPWVAAEGKHGWELGLEWIDSKQERIAAAGWATICNVVSIKDDADLDLSELKRLLARVQKTINEQPNRVRYAMNAFVISLGCYVKSLTEAALKAAAKIGTIEVDMGDTACKVPSAVEYIQKVQKRGTIGKKRTTCKC